MSLAPGMSGRHLWVSFLLIMLAHGLIYLVYTNGFFLTRYEVENTSSCANVPLAGKQVSQACWHPPQFDHVIVLLIDALRWDFLVWNDTISAHDTSIPHYMNKLPIVRELLKSEEDNALVFKLIADPPTTTAQRLKGITTGGLPTFIDLKNNFNSSSVSEDNIVRQLRENSKNTVLMGDDTWLNLYPDDFSHAYVYPSFNVRDLHTVDQGCILHLHEALEKHAYGNVDFLVAHFLGVDHVGHTYSPYHPVMQSKLQEMNSIINNTVQHLPSNSLLLIMGDHGMTADGNHGGASAEETDAGLFAYTNRPDGFWQPSSSSSSSSSLPDVRQIDLVPSIALALGLPIPFSSLGTVIAPLVARNSDELQAALQLNMGQVMRYLQTYSASSGDMDVEDLAHFEQLSQSAATPAAITAVLAAILDMCTHKWVAFDDVAMWSAGIAMGIVMVTQVVLVFVDQGWGTWPGPRPWSWIALVGMMAWWASGESQVEKWWDSRALVQFVAIAFVLWLSVFWLRGSGLAEVEGSGKKRKFASPVALIALLCRMLACFSNSFIEAEGPIITWTLGAFLIYHLLVEGYKLRETSWLLAGVGFTCLLVFPHIQPTVSHALPELDELLVAQFASRMAAEGGWQLQLLLPLRLGFWSLLPLYLLHRLLSHYNYPRRSFLMAILWLVALYVAGQIMVPSFELSGPGWWKLWVPRTVFGACAMLLGRGLMRGCVHDMVGAVAIAWIMVLGPSGLLFGAVGTCFVGVLHSALRAMEATPMEVALWHYQLASLLFFASGHICKFSHLHIGASFVGFETFTIFSIVLGVLNAAGGYLLGPLLLCLYYSQTLSISEEGRNCFLWALAVYGTAFALQTACSTLCVGIMRRHLMTWAIFAPKFIFDVLMLAVADILVVTLLCIFTFRR
jgi:hypothetical protein